MAADASDYPTNADSIPRTNPSDNLTGHSDLHDKMADAIEEIQGFVGVSGDTTAGTLVKRVSDLEGKDITVTFDTGSDLDGSFTITNLGNVTNTTVAVRNDSHTHDGRYFTETEVNAALAALGNTYYTETEVNAALAALSNTYYTETEVDNALAAKLNSSAYTANDVLTKIKTVDGAGSGLDADLLDGNQASAFSLAHSHPYLSSTGTAVNSQLLDSLDSSQFLRSDTADTATGLITFYRNAGTDWTDATAVVRSSNEQCSLTLRGGGDSTTYDKNTIQLRTGNTGGASPQPLLYMRNHDDSDNANIQVKNIYYSGSLFPVSSLTVKNTIQDYDGATAVIDSLRPVTFLYNASPDMGKQVGLIAEEVQAVDPMFVEETDVPSLNLNSIVGLAIAGLQEANTRITELEAKVAELEGR